MVDANVHCIIDVLHILPRPSKHGHITIHIMKEAIIKLELCLQPLTLKHVIMTSKILKHERVFYSKILLICLRKIRYSFTNQMKGDINVLQMLEK